MKYLLCVLLTGVAMMAKMAAAEGARMPEAGRIDAILAKAWEKAKVTGNAVAPDEVFVRRVYLDVIGRIPTLEEARAFLNSQAADKRGKLIDQLLASDGYVSNFFNYYADILRLQTDTKGRLTGEAYANWLKAALKKNQTYDSMVRELLTTDGNAWESGAIGFYMRDQGMPLDHLAATVQIFLGTRIECAQCHNHPFDKWTQKDYYQMAAFTYGMDTVRKGYGLDVKGMAAGDRKMLRGPEGQQMRRDFKEVQESIKEVTKSLRYTQIKETDKLPKLPPEYKYPDAKPGETMQPKTLFGHDAIPGIGETRLDAFAKWLTSPENPRFTTVIANRLWKKVMGMGLIEPVDEITDSTVASNPELMSYLEEVMIQKGYNLKDYLRVLLNSGVYQRMPSTKDVLLGETYAFTGPLMRRMSAEQIWDSIATLMHGDIDTQAAGPDEDAIQKLAALGKLYETLTSKTPMELVRQIRESGGGAGNPEKEAKIKELTEQMAAARRDGKKDEAAKLGREVAELRRGDRQQAFAAVLGEEGARQFAMEMKSGKGKEKGNMPVMALSRDELRKMKAAGVDKKTIRQKLEEMRAAGKNAGAMASATRASELPSPAPRGHMLRIFGQSDREIIENASRESAVPQALSMLNGPVADALVNPISYFAKQLQQTNDAAARMDAIYLGLLCRHPSETERAVLAGVVAERGEKATADVVHALLNTGEFLFVK